MLCEELLSPNGQVRDQFIFSILCLVYHVVVLDYVCFRCRRRDRGWVRRRKLPGHLVYR